MGMLTLCVRWYFIICSASSPIPMPRTGYELNYTKILFPKAAVSSQRISESLAEIGTEDSKRMFFAAYYAFLKNRAKLARKRKKAGRTDPIAGSNGVDCGDSGILIDSTGLPNSSHMPFTAISSHNGMASEEARLDLRCAAGKEPPPFFKGFMV